MAVSITLHPDLQRFAPGTTVKAYKRSNFAGSWNRTGAPEGSQDASATVSASGVVTFTGLTAETEYVLYAASPNRYASFSTKTESVGGTSYSGAQDFSGATVTLPSGLVVPANSVDAAAIQDGTITAAKLAFDVATQAELDAAVAGISSADASATVKGISKLSVAPAVAGTPIAAGDNDTRMTDTREPVSPSMSGLVLPIGIGGGFAMMAFGAPAANTLYLARIVVPKTGRLRDVSTFVVGQNGNVIGAIYDTGDASAGNYTKLADSGTVAVGAALAWQTIWDPNLAVTKGQHLMIGLISSGTASFMRTQMADSGLGVLPSSFLVAGGGALSKIATQISPGSFTVPTPIAEASLLKSQLLFLVACRIS